MQRYCKIEEQERKKKSIINNKSFYPQQGAGTPQRSKHFLEFKKYFKKVSLS
jgi:hypothetical protein